MQEEKSLKVSEPLWRDLMNMKYDLKLGSMDELLRIFLTVYRAQQIVVEEGTKRFSK